jgi:uncharacterized protein YlzI (FlbEa/FlbD family)
MNFKKLTTKDGNTVFLNTDLATEMRRTNKNTATLVYFGKDYVLVKESPEEIFQLPCVYDVQY